MARTSRHDEKCGLVMSLWPVDDRAGRLLMQFFYAHLQTGPAEALRSAQRSKLSRDLLWQRRMRRLSALSTNHVRKLILSDVCLPWRHLGYLMPPRLSFRSRPGGRLRQASTAVSALLRQQYFDGAHLRRGNQLSMMASVPG